jgi:hypothetical protein
MVETKTKNMLYGAAVQLVPKSISQATFNYYNLVQKVPSEELRKNPWYAEPFGPALPPIDDWVCDVGIPAALLLAGAFTKKQTLKDMGLGAALTGAATFVHDVLSRMANWIK